jgi:hypothetical protein
MKGVGLGSFDLRRVGLDIDGWRDTQAAVVRIRYRSPLAYDSHQVTCYLHINGIQYIYCTL